MKLILAIAALLLVAGEAQAQTNFLDNPRPYVGAGVGYSKSDTGIEEGTADLDDHDLGYKFFGGVRLNKYLGVEGFYASFGGTSLSGNAGDTFRVNGTNRVFSGSGEVGLSGWSVGAAAAAGYPVHEYFNPYAKFGVHRWEAELEISGPAGTATTDKDGIDIVYGAGFQSNITSNVALRGEWERYQLDDNNVDMFTAALVYKF